MLLESLYHSAYVVQNIPGRNACVYQYTHFGICAKPAGAIDIKSSVRVSIAQNAAELFAASGSQEDFAALLGAEKTARGTLRAAYDVQGGWTEDETQGAYVLEAVLDETPRQAGEMRTAHFVVTAADGDTVLYELDTQKYIGG